jgi:hypothetical protein
MLGVEHEVRQSGRTMAQAPRRFAEVVFEDRAR